MAGTDMFSVIIVLILFNAHIEAASVSATADELKGILQTIHSLITTRFDNLETSLLILKHDVATDIGILNSSITDMTVACKCRGGHQSASRPLGEINSDRIDRVSVRLQDLEMKFQEYIRQLEDGRDEMMTEASCQTLLETGSPGSSQSQTTASTTTASPTTASTRKTTTNDATHQPQSTSGRPIRMTSRPTTQTHTPPTSSPITPTLSRIKPTPSRVTPTPSRITPTPSSLSSTYWTAEPSVTAPETTMSDTSTTTTPQTSTSNPDCNDTDPIYKHLKEREGFSLTGNIPTSGSGVTIASGVDLGQQTESGLRALGVQDSIINKLRPYLGLTTAKEVADASLAASNLKLTEEEACSLDKALLDKTTSVIDAYGTKMSVKGRAVLASLRHWAGALGNTKGQGKLSVTVGQGTNNFVWDAIRGKTATDSDLKSALKKTLGHHTPATAAYNRIRHEIQYLSN